MIGLIQECMKACSFRSGMKKLILRFVALRLSPKQGDLEFPRCRLPAETRSPKTSWDDSADLSSEVGCSGTSCIERILSVAMPPCSSNEKLMLPKTIL